MALLDEKPLTKAGSELLGSPRGKTASDIFGTKLSLNWAKKIALSTVYQHRLLSVQDITQNNIQTASPIEPPKDLIEIISPVAMVSRSFGVLSWERARITQREDPSPTPKITGYNQTTVEEPFVAVDMQI